MYINYIIYNDASSLRLFVKKGHFVAFLKKLLAAYIIVCANASSAWCMFSSCVVQEDHLMFTKMLSSVSYTFSTTVSHHQSVVSIWIVISWFSWTCRITRKPPCRAENIFRRQNQLLTAHFILGPWSSLQARKLWYVRKTSMVQTSSESN